MTTFRTDPSKLPDGLHRFAGRSLSDKEKIVLVVCRDPGPANALMPVIDELVARDGRIGFAFFIDGKAKDILVKRYGLTCDRPGGDAGLSASADAGSRLPPVGVILTSASVSSDELETRAREAYPGVPCVAVEDNYRMSYAWLARLKALGLPPPALFAAIDQSSAEEAVRRFPGLSAAWFGQPAFDRFMTERTEAIAREVRRKLLWGTPGYRLVAFMGTPDLLPLIEQVAVHVAVAQVKRPFRFVYCRHPRDASGDDAYRAALERTCMLDSVDNAGCTNDQIACAADVVITTWSTEALHAICRRKPVIYLHDDRYVKPDPGVEFPMPPVTAGAALDVHQVEDLPKALNDLLDSGTGLAFRLKEAAAALFPLRDRAAVKVAAVVRSYLGLSATGEEAAHDPCWYLG